MATLFQSVSVQIGGGGKENLTTIKSAAFSP